jgi:hypothetical protein
MPAHERSPGWPRGGGGSRMGGLEQLLANNRNAGNLIVETGLN